MSKPKRPQGHHSITPSLIVPNAAKVIDFVKKAFDAKELERYEGPGGSVMHAELLLGDSAVMLGEPMPGLEPMPAALAYYVDDGPAVDATYQCALKAGAESLNEPTDQPWGYRSACVRDSGGNRWTISAVIEEVSKEEIERRMANWSSPEG